MRYLNTIVKGYDEIEPCIIAALALRANIFLEGKHGIGNNPTYTNCQ